MTFSVSLVTLRVPITLKHELDIEQITGIQQPLYHRYSTEENEEEDDEEGGNEFKAGPFDFQSDMITEGVSGMDIHGMYLSSENQEDPYGMEYAGEEGWGVHNDPH